MVKYYIFKLRDAMTNELEIEGLILDDAVNPLPDEDLVKTYVKRAYANELIQFTETDKDGMDSLKSMLESHSYHMNIFHMGSEEIIRMKRFLDSGRLTIAEKYNEKLNLNKE